MLFYQELDTIWLVRFLKKLSIGIDYQLYKFYDDVYYNARANQALGRFIREIVGIEEDMRMESDDIIPISMSDDRLQRYKLYMRYAKIYKDRYTRLLWKDWEEALKAYTIYEHYKWLAEHCIQEKTTWDLSLNTTNHDTKRN